MNYEEDNCKKIDVDGIIASGNQYDIEIVIPEDNRDVIYGVLKDCFKKPICDAVVKLIEVENKHGKKIRKPVSHTFTDSEGEFVFGPLCPHKKYEIQFWANRVNHIKMCAKCTHEGDCLEGVKLDACKDLFDEDPCDKPCNKPCTDICDKPFEDPCSKFNDNKGCY